MEESVLSLEKEAQTLLSQGETERAHQLLKQAAQSCANSGNHRQAALMYASAASVWGKVYGDKSFFASAKLYEAGAKQALKYNDYDYATMLFRYAAINYERDGEFVLFSDCFYNSREARRKSLLYSILHKKNSGILKNFKRLIQWIMMGFSCMVWGYGEKPFRTLASGIVVILVSALFYTFGGLIKRGVIFDPNYFDALYFSVATITTLGYGDIAPMGLSRFIAMIEAFCGIFIMPIFIVGLSRKYLRV